MASSIQLERLMNYLPQHMLKPNDLSMIQQWITDSVNICKHLTQQDAKMALGFIGAWIHHQRSMWSQYFESTSNLDLLVVMVTLYRTMWKDLLDCNADAAGLVFMQHVRRFHDTWDRLYKNNQYDAPRSMCDWVKQEIKVFNRIKEYDEKTLIKHYNDWLQHLDSMVDQCSNVPTGLINSLFDAWINKLIGIDTSENKSKNK